MKTKLLSLAATILFAASANTAFADIEYYLVCADNGWDINQAYKFTSTETGIYTLTKTIGGEFKIKEKNGDVVTWVGAKSDGVYQVKPNSSVATLLWNDGQNLNLQFRVEYTFTINTNNQYTLHIGGLDEYLIEGSFNGNAWGAPKRMTKQSDGSYTFVVNNGDKFKFRDFYGTYYGASSNTDTHQIKPEWHTNIDWLAGDNGKDFEIVNSEGSFTGVLKDGKLTVLGYTISFDETLSCGSPSSYQNQVYNVQIDERTLYCDGYWNTICLPFNVDDFRGTIFNDADVMTLESSEFDAGTLTLNFNTANSISAGVPYIVRWSDRGDDIKNPYFPNVTINSTVGQSGTGPATFVGCINPITIPETDCENTDYLYLGAENTLYYPSSSITIGAFRAYFKLNLPEASQGIKSFVLNFDDDTETTSIKQINSTASATDSYFTLDGRRLNDKPATAGLYIINGKKVVIK